MSITLAKPLAREIKRLTGVSEAALASPSRVTHVVAARHAFVLVMRERSAWSYPQIGHFLGGRDHSTIVNSERKALARCASDPEFAALVDALREIEPGNPFERDNVTPASVNRAVSRIPVRLPPYSGPIRDRYHEEWKTSDGRLLRFDCNGNTEYETLAINDIRHGSRMLAEAILAARAAA